MQVNLIHTAAAAQAQAPADTAKARAARAAAEDFEAVFLSQMLAPMFEGLSSDSLFGGGHGEEVFRSVLVDEMGKAVARGGGVGLADAVHRELLALQEIGS